MSKKLITLVAPGSRGDVTPAIALGMGLKEAGYRVKVATHANFSDFVTKYGLDFGQIYGDFQTALGTPRGLEVLEGKEFNPFLDRELLIQMRDGWKACRRSDAIIFFPVGIWAQHIAEALQIPCFLASFVPLDQTTEFSFLRFQNRAANLIERVYNYSTYPIAQMFLWQKYAEKFNQFREEIGLQKLTFFDYAFDFNNKYRLHNIPSLYCFNSAIIPRPEDWLSHKYITGNWLLPETSYQPPNEIVKFIESGDSPIYIGFGSMIFREPAKIATILQKVVSHNGIRAVIGSGWANLDRYISNTDNIYVIKDYIPFSWLFQHIKLVIHHGGSGTINLALRAGLPQIILPFFADQPQWAELLYQLGVSPQPIPIQKVNVNNLSQIISNTLTGEHRSAQTPPPTDSDVTSESQAAVHSAPPVGGVPLTSNSKFDRAKILQKQILSEGNGVEKAIKIINSYLN